MRLLIRDTEQRDPRFMMSLGESSGEGMRALRDVLVAALPGEAQRPKPSTR